MADTPFNDAHDPLSERVAVALGLKRLNYNVRHQGSLIRPWLKPGGEICVADYEGADSLVGEMVKWLEQHCAIVNILRCAGGWYIITAGPAVAVSATTLNLALCRAIVAVMEAN